MNNEFYEPEQVFDLSKLQDRGSKKWVAMMLPEHVALLREYSIEIKREPKPDLNEWDLHAIEETIQCAIKRKSEILLKLWKNGVIELYGGTIESVDLKHRTLELDNPFGIKEYNLDEIVDVTIMD
ncbi:YolD-like family protein [Psychrobacillus sp. BM2]|uniref:YolD-like family protein n=1 Tax=Psychrobacillus sp. BM2 TaxID=3400421 RepID=UPI003B020BE1